MTIKRVAMIGTDDVSSWAWDCLSRFENVSQVKRRISDRWQLGSNQNAVKQAEQLRFCLIQAREYFHAARAVGDATRPLLLYYGCMSLALAEVLWKQDGNSSLDKARESHRSHGLELSVNIPRQASLDVFAQGLRAAPHTRRAENSGTFELWRRSATFPPAVGKASTTSNTKGSFDELRLFFSGNSPVQGLTDTGIDLWSILKSLPGLYYHMHDMGFDTELCRMTVSSLENLDSRFHRVLAIFHPSTDKVLKWLMDTTKFDAKFVDRIEVRESGLGFVLTIDMSNENSLPGQYPTVMKSSPEFGFIAANEINLNEFGLYYAFLFICGNLARYYPDLWVKGIESRTDFSFLVNRACLECETRLPLLLYSELAETMFI